MKKINKCKCGSESFWVREELIWKASLDEQTGDLDCKNLDCEITLLKCSKCNKKYKEDNFNQINFN